jgi:hypothetical protein
MKYLLLLPLTLFACSDWPTKDSQENEQNPIEINIDINNSLNDPADNDTTEIDVDSNSDSQSDSQSDSDSSSEATIDNSTGLIYYEFKMIN